MEKRFQSVESMIRFWILKEEMHQRQISQEKLQREFSDDHSFDRRLPSEEEGSRKQT